MTYFGIDSKICRNMFWQVQPDLEDLTVNMEDNEGMDGSQPKSHGKLQFSLDYDFQKGEVVITALHSIWYKTDASSVTVTLSSVHCWIGYRETVFNQFVEAYCEISSTNIL